MFGIHKLLVGLMSVDRGCQYDIVSLLVGLDENRVGHKNMIHDNHDSFISLLGSAIMK